MASPRVLRKAAGLGARPGLKIRRVPDWEAAGWAGLLAAFCMALLEIFLMPLSAGAGLLSAPRMTADILFDGSLPALGAPALLAITFFSHFTLALLWSRLLAGFLFARPRADVVPLGVAFGLVLYAFNFHVIGSLLPRLYADRNWVWLLSHAVFGAVAASAYARWERLVYE